MNAIHIIARTDDTVTLSATDHEALLAAAEDVEDIGTLRVAEAREAEIGKGAAHHNLSDESVGRLLAGEHPIRIWREHRGLTSRALADKAGVSRSYLTEIEGLKKPGSIQAFRSLAAALGVAVDDLLFDGVGRWRARRCPRCSRPDRCAAVRRLRLVSMPPIARSAAQFAQGSTHLSPCAR